MRPLCPALGLVFVLVGSQLTSPVVRATPRETAVAFHGAYQGTATLLASHPPMMEKIVATGRATTLGTSTLHATATVGAINPGGCQPFTGHGHLSAAGGSWITYRYSYAPCFRPSPPFRDWVLTGYYTITGGGGMLRGARGSGSYIARFQQNPSGYQAPPGDVMITLRGTLRLP